METNEEENVNEVIKAARRTAWGKYLTNPEETFKEWMSYLSIPIRRR